MRDSYILPTNFRTLWDTIYYTTPTKDVPIGILPPDQTVTISAFVVLDDYSLMGLASYMGRKLGWVPSRDLGPALLMVNNSYI